jgi:type I restriction enzyme, S subunit
MSDTGWPLVPLRELLTPSGERVSVSADSEYPNFGIYSFGRGVFVKTPIKGSTSSATALFRAKKNQFVYSRLFAFEGAYGIVPDELDGYLVSNEFPLFNCDNSRLLPGYLGWFFRNPIVWPDVARLTTGMGNRRQRIKAEALLSYTLPLPPLQEQERVVARIDSIASKHSEIVKLRQQSDEVCSQVCRSLLSDRRFGDPTPTRMSDLVSWRRANVAVVPNETYQFAGVYCFGRGLFVGQRRTGMEFAYKEITQLNADEFVYPKLMAWEGALGVVPAECDGLFVSPEFPVFTVNKERVLPEVLDVYFRSPAVWPSLGGASTGTNVRRKRLNPKDFLSYEFPLPSREAQVALRSVRQRMSELQTLQNQKSQINALLPSILDRALKGEL